MRLDGYNHYRILNESCIWWLECCFAKYSTQAIRRKIYLVYAYYVWIKTRIKKNKYLPEIEFGEQVISHES